MSDSAVCVVVALEPVNINNNYVASKKHVMFTSIAWNPGQLRTLLFSDIKPSFNPWSFTNFDPFFVTLAGEYNDTIFSTR